MNKLIHNEYIVPFRELSMKDVARVGGKNASLGEMISNLAGAGVSVPDGYATTEKAFWEFLEHDQLRQRIKDRLEGLDINNVKQLAKAGKEIRQWIIDAPFQADLEQSIDALRHIFIKRGDFLLKSCIHSINKKDSLTAAIIARSLLELSAIALRHAAKIKYTFSQLKDEIPLGTIREQIIECPEVQEILLLSIWGTRIKERTKISADLKQYHVTKILKEVAEKEETP